MQKCDNCTIKLMLGSAEDTGIRFFLQHHKTNERNSQLSQCHHVPTYSHMYSLVVSFLIVATYIV